MSEEPNRCPHGYHAEDGDFCPDCLEGRALQDLLDAARRHGEESDPDHEVGDLQDLLRACWRVMTYDQMMAVLSSEEAELVIGMGGDE